MVEIGIKIVLGLESNRNCFEQLRVSIHNLAASPANQMDMRTVLDRSVRNLPFTKVDACGQALIHEHIEGTINRSQIECLRTGLNLREDLFSGHVIVGMGNDLDDYFPLRGDAVSFSA